jgi:hypothetical protein
MKINTKTIKNSIYERVPENITTRPWMKACYRDYARRDIVMAAWPLNYVVQAAWMINLAWSKYRHQKSWIDREVEKKTRMNRDFERINFF